jgi:chorismate mutase / prephenate dehydratase
MAGADKDKINKLRIHIDALDEKIQKLISERAQIAVDIAKAKASTGTNNFYRPEREAEVLSKVMARHQGPLSAEEMARLFREIMSACLALESRLRVAFLGPEGTFTQTATLKHFGHSIDSVPQSSISDVFREVESGSAHFGVVPVENSTEGVINHTLDMFIGSPLRICGEVELRVHHYLLARDEEWEAAVKIVSHQQSLAQCREWLDANYPGVERVAVSSNAEAARIASQQTGVLAIASDSAAQIYGLKIIASKIEDKPDNTTRFLVVGRLDAGRSGSDKTSLLVSGKNRPGSLYRLLTPLARGKLNMTRIESRPSRRMQWEYVFFIDVDGHIKDAKVARALKGLEKESAFFKWLGSYPKAVL